MTVARTKASVRPERSEAKSKDGPSTSAPSFFKAEGYAQGERSPQHGVLRTLRELCEKSITTVDPKCDPERPFRYIDISAVNNSTKQIVTPQLVRGKGASVRARQLVRTNDVLVSTTRPNLNAVALVPEQLDSQICSTGFCVLRCGAELDPDYLFCFVRSQRFVGALVELVQGALYPAVTDKQVFAQVIPWVPLHAQRRIAARLKTQLAAAEIARQAAQAQAMELKALVDRLQETEFQKLAYAPRVRLGEILRGIETGKSFQTTDRIAKANELGVLKVSAVSWSEFKPQEAKAVTRDYAPEPHHRVRAGDLLMSRANTLELVGAVVHVPTAFPNRLLSDKTLRLVLDESLACAGYVVRVLRMQEARSHIEANATGTSSSMRNISQDAIRAIPIPLHGLRDQCEVAERMWSIERSVAKAQSAVIAQLADLEALPARLLAQAFDCTDKEA